jgi:hypothetical protein
MGLFVRATVAGSTANRVRIDKVSDLRSTAGSFVANSLEVAKEPSKGRYVLRMTCSAKRGTDQGDFIALLSFAKADAFKANLSAAITRVEEYAGKPAGEFTLTILAQAEVETRVDMPSLAAKIGPIRLGACSAIPHCTSRPGGGKGVAEKNFHIVIITGQSQIEGLPFQGRAGIKGRGMFDVFISVPDARKLLKTISGH